MPLPKFRRTSTGFHWIPTHWHGWAVVALVVVGIPAAWFFGGADRYAYIAAILLLASVLHFVMSGDA